MQIERDKHEGVQIITADITHNITKDLYLFHFVAGDPENPNNYKHFGVNLNNREKAIQGFRMVAQLLEEM